MMIVSSYAPPSIGGPQNLYNLFRDTDPSSYCILTSFYNIDNTSAELGTWLLGEYIFYDKKGETKKTGEKPVRIYSPSFGRKVITKLKYLVKRNKFVKQLISISLIVGQVLSIVHSGQKAIKAKKITSLITISDYGPAMIGGYLLHKITKKPYSIFLFDLYRWNYLPFPGNPLAKIFEPHMFKAANNIIVTNEGTKEFYEKKYGKVISNKMTTIHNSTFGEPYKKVTNSHDPKLPYIIMFTGRIYWPQIQPLLNLIKAVNSIKDVDIKIKIYCPNPKDYLEKIGIKESEKVSIDMAPPQDMPKIQRSADILFLPLTFKGESMNIVNTATPGKLADYLIVGKPMLVHAPASSYLARYAKENNFAAVIEEDNIGKLVDGIKKIILDKKFSDTIVENAQRTFSKNHDANKNAILFRKVFDLENKK